MHIADERFDAELMARETLRWTTANLPDTEIASLHASMAMLAIGGHAVVPGTQIADAWVVGAWPVDGESALLADETNDTCHANCLDAGAGHHLGYALSADGIWHEHSWLVVDGAVVETTGTPRLAYLGVDASLLPQKSLALLQDEMVSSEDWFAHEDAARSQMQAYQPLDVAEARDIIDSAAARRRMHLPLAA